MVQVGLPVRHLQFLSGGEFSADLPLVLVVEKQRWFFKPLVLVKILAGTMDLFVVIFLLGLVLGAAAVASNPSPYFGALGLVVAAGMGSGLLMLVGGSFLSLVLFLIYLGGMLVVFAYTAALSSEEYPETLGSWPVGVRMLTYLAVVGWSVFVVSREYGSYFKGGGLSDVAVVRVDTSGVVQLY